jgi:hypothetical protein
MHARFYNPNWGRFLSVDPAGGAPRLPQTWNRYTYVHNNPVNFIDPFGLYPCPTRGSDGKMHPGECIEVKGRVPRAGSVLGGASTFRDLLRWATGRARPHQAAAPAAVEELADTPAMDNIREAFKKKGCTEGMYFSDFQFAEVIATGNWTGQLVGAFGARIAPVGNGQVVINATNTWGLESATRIPGTFNRANLSIQTIATDPNLATQTFMHSSPLTVLSPKSVLENRTGNGPFSNVTMHYVWMEGSPCGS